MLALESFEMKHKVFTMTLLLLHLSCTSPGQAPDPGDVSGPLVQPLNYRQCCQE